MIEKNPGYADDIARIAAETASLAEASDFGQVSLDALEIQVRDRIAWEKLTPEESLLIDALIVSVCLELDRAEKASERAPAGREVLYRAAVVLRWIKQAARLKA